MCLIFKYAQFFCRQWENGRIILLKWVFRYCRLYTKVTCWFRNSMEYILRIWVWTGMEGFYMACSSWVCVCKPLPLVLLRDVETKHRVQSRSKVLLLEHSARTGKQHLYRTPTCTQFPFPATASHFTRDPVKAHGTRPRAGPKRCK